MLCYFDWQIVKNVSDQHVTSVFIVQKSLDASWTARPNHRGNMPHPKLQ
jgi:hypothetical protein